MSITKRMGTSILRSCCIVLGVSVGMVSGVAAETEAQGGAAAQDMPAPLVAVELDNGNTVEFYEPAPGLLFISEDGIAPNEPRAATGPGMQRELVQQPLLWEW